MTQKDHPLTRGENESPSAASALQQTSQEPGGAGTGALTPKALSFADGGHGAICPVAWLPGPGCCVLLKSSRAGFLSAAAQRVAGKCRREEDGRADDVKPGTEWAPHRGKQPHLLRGKQKVTE